MEWGTALKPTRRQFLTALAALPVAATTLDEVLVLQKARQVGASTMTANLMEAAVCDNFWLQSPILCYMRDYVLTGELADI